MGECLRGLCLTVGTVSEVCSEEGQSLNPNQSSLQLREPVFFGEAAFAHDLHGMMASGEDRGHSFEGLDLSLGPGSKSKALTGRIAKDSINVVGGRGKGCMWSKGSEVCL